MLTTAALSLGRLENLPAAPTLELLVEFTSNGATNRGATPYAALTLAADGNFYGTTRMGGTLDYGTIFRMTPNGVLTTLVDFTSNGASNRGADPTAALVQGSDGNFYGTTYLGGALGYGGGGQGFGTVFRMTPAGVLTTLIDFSNGAPAYGSNPYGGLAVGPDGNLYGTTVFGGTTSGTAFRVTPDGTQTDIVDFTFNGASNRGATPYGGLMLAPDGNFYGTTEAGGATVYNYGTIFRLKPTGALTTLVDFTADGPSNRGAGPYAPPTLGADGNFYGTTRFGGASGFGTIYKMTPAGALTTLFESYLGTFPNLGGNFSSGLLLGPDNNLYGTAETGGGVGYGTVYRITPAGVLTLVASFSGNGGATPGSTPYAVPVKGADGNLYGTTSRGGAFGFGTIYRLRFGPTPLTQPATPIFTTSATLNGTLNANGASSNAVFEYGTSPGALTNTSSPQSVAAGTSPVPVVVSVTGLNANTIYYFRLRGDNGDQFQPQRGDILSFLTNNGPKFISVSPAAGGQLVRWQDQAAGASYRVQYNDDLMAAWQLFAGTVTSDSGGVIDFVDLAPPTQRFYRLVSVP
ncbi:hypothetical protein AYO41_03995 [Verrucomicrobia bacterium SCGC AG-212-E04]|nr:hypothetical protein AYO41_03995 [Verrucomicrobia bacterium SCGC AG-212-E04]